MAQSKAETVLQYLEELAQNRRESISTVRNVILDHLPAGYQEAMNWGMISYEVPLTIFPETYNKKPLLYCALAAQKQYNSIYLMNIYSSKRLERALKKGFARAGKKLTMGKSCVRFRNHKDLALDVIAEIVAATSLQAFLEIYRAGRK